MSPTTLQAPKPNPGAAGQGEPKIVQQPQQRTVQITYSPSAWALIQAPFPLSEADWEAMIDTLNGMKRGLVQPDQWRGIY